MGRASDHCWFVRTAAPRNLQRDKRQLPYYSVIVDGDMDDKLQYCSLRRANVNVVAARLT